ncbi:hypothetical protein HNQ51_002840 [Inhella inkyongensis]|uniref:Uncharacterized protein n=1 Tax=Inhella inkyongensis TaxID=392593 RepID=A0A840SAK0_9BURK|nr:hypothetical protein [Inhella inkyongensis]MBB5205521.1 hypothetical protein [Inhella inkyongensis]
MVIKQVKHWIKHRANASAWKAMQEWAEARGARFEQMEEGEGFEIEEPGNAVGRLLIEWGPAQRSYVEGAELRLRWELGLNADLQMMVMERELCDRLESSVFEAYTDTLQTRIDTDTPEEMRWLVMFAKLDQWKSKLARSRFTACAMSKEVAGAWIEGPLSEALALASQDLVPAGRPLVMLTQRGNLYLRLALSEPSLEALQGVVKLAEIAAKQAKQVHQVLGEAGVWPASAAAIWPASSQMQEEP